MQKLSLQADKFELPGNVHYLNGAFMSPQLKSITQVGLDSVQKKILPYKMAVDDFFDGPQNIRQEFSKLINNKEPNRIALVPSVSYGMANIVANVDFKDKEVLVAGEQFPSNVLPWMSATKHNGGKLVVIDPPLTIENRGTIWNDRILEAIKTNTTLVAISQAHWADGTLFNIKEIRKRTNDVGALLIIDGTQSVGAYAFDIEEIKPDALICAGYKWLLGAYGLGVAYYGEYFDDAHPVEDNWINRLNSEDFTGLVEYEENYQPGALRFNVGEQSNFVLVPMLTEALRQINEWQPEQIQEYCNSIVEEPILRLRSAGFWIEEENWRTSHLFGIRHESMPLEKIKTALMEKNIFVSYRGSAIRVSPYVHNTIDDMNLLADTLIENLS